MEWEQSFKSCHSYWCDSEALHVTCVLLSLHFLVLWIEQAFFCGMKQRLLSEVHNVDEVGENLQFNSWAD